VAWLRATRPDDGWPDWSDAALVAHAEQWLAPFLGRARRAADLDRIDVRAALLAGLDWQQQRSIDELAPTHWTTTSGRRVALRYGEVDGEPGTVLAAVALRDVLGTDVHPTIGAARTPVTLELLSPAGRPVQRTNDLPGFWRGSYTAVRADLRGRYPKHPWPERPWEPR
jgi:ATP-dependent helicase HrpB